MKAVDEAIMALIRADVSLKVRFDILVSIPGVSQITAFTLLIEMPELGELDEKAAAALCGLAPISRQSGRWTGRAFIAGGRPIVRHALYMPALVACRFNPDLKTKYEDLVKAGKPPKVAITAVMRKLIVLANALLRKNRNGHQNSLDQNGYSRGYGGSDCVSFKTVGRYRQMSA
ncbi:Transposase IS116/IS110/IS902 family protein [Rhizobium sp. NFR03]|nr:Transposase IS116/IS110/IS902 family protein [Rhizobium sp. NFR03]